MNKCEEKTNFCSIETLVFIVTNLNGGITSCVTVSTVCKNKYAYLSIEIEIVVIFYFKIVPNDLMWP